MAGRAWKGYGQRALAVGAATKYEVPGGGFGCDLSIHNTGGEVIFALINTEVGDFDPAVAVPIEPGALYSWSNRDIRQIFSVVLQSAGSTANIAFN